MSDNIVQENKLTDKLSDIKDSISSGVGKITRNLDYKMSDLKEKKESISKNKKHLNLDQKKFQELKDTYNKIMNLTSYNMSEYSKYDKYMNKLCSLLSIQRKGLTIKSIKFNEKNYSVDVDLYYVKKK